MGKVKQKESNTKSPPPSFMIDRLTFAKTVINQNYSCWTLLTARKFSICDDMQQIYAVFIWKLLPNMKTTNPLYTS